MIELSRRKLLRTASVLAASSTTEASHSGTTAQQRYKVVVVGAHPDDPESSCGGTVARYSDFGHEVVLLYLTRGEAGIPGKTASEAATIRTLEAQRACEILKARPIFVGQIDGTTEISRAHYDHFRSLIEKEQPDVAFVPWPIDSHRDHRVASMLAYDAWERSGHRFELYFSEVNLGAETKSFQPTHYVDISMVVERKRLACFAHQSQNPNDFYGHYHEPMQRFRGLEAGCQAAEAFVRAAQSPPRYCLPA